MAITDSDLFNSKKQFTNWSSYNVQDRLIRGKAINLVYSASHVEQIHFKEEAQFRELIKNKLANQIAKQILEQKLGYFTHSYDINGNMIIRARCFLLPDDQVFIIKEIIE